jgi:fluoride exporter
MLKNIILVGLGGGIGSILRYAGSFLIPAKYFPWSTLAVNIFGSFIIGLVLAYSLKDGFFSNNWKLFLATGVCGGFTTFSAFTAENLTLLQNGKYGIALFYIALSVILGIGAAFLGYQVVVKN